MSAGIEPGWCGSRAVAVLPEGTLARDGTREYSRGTPAMGTVRGYRRGTSLLWVRRSTAERPSPLWVCSDLSFNTLNGSVPSSLSALINLAFLCVRLRHTAFALAADVGRIGRHCSERAACRGMHVGGIEGDGAAAGLLRYSQEGTSGPRCD